MYIYMESLNGLSVPSHAWTGLFFLLLFFD
jgi:hypothetical protein